MGSVIGAVFGLVCFYFWITGWWFAALVVWIGLALITGPIGENPRGLLISTIIAWAPFVVRLYLTERRAKESLRISLTNPRDASF